MADTPNRFKKVKKTSGINKPEQTAVNLIKDSAHSSKNLRRSLASLYGLAAKASQNIKSLSSTKGVADVKPVKFAIPQIQTEQRYTSEQVWGQLNVLYAPVLKSLDQRMAEGEAAAENMVQYADTKLRRRVTIGDADAAEGDEFGEEHLQQDEAEGEQDVMDEDEEDEIFTGAPKVKKPSKLENKKDSWRYAFGLGDDDEDEEGFGDEDEGAKPKRPVDDEEDEEDFDKNALDDEERDGLFDEADDGEYHDRFGGEDDDGDFDDDDAALKELYGEGNYDEGEAFGGASDEDGDGIMGGDDMADLELPGEDGEEGYGGDFGGDEGEDGRVIDGDAEMSRAEGRRVGDDDDADPTSTNFQRQERKRLREIQDLEESRLFDKPWTMAGEVAAKARPMDALIDEQLDFEHALRPVPIVTQAFTDRLEERIRRRIVDGVFDDVQRRKMRTTAADLTTTKRDEGIEAQKSKLSLMDLYEKEYLEKQKAARADDSAQHAEPLTEIEKDELKAINMWKRLSQHLDALSNFFFTPKPVQEDMQARVRAIENQAPAIAMESVGVLGVKSKESALAPQDLFRARKEKFAGVAKEEMDPKEKQALRRAQKTASKEKKERIEVMKKRSQAEKAHAKAKAAAATA